jgi:F0F1-type ATP synthase membrane subunit c/vacuolar-type H+-ATPase subunit K
MSENLTMKMAGAAEIEYATLREEMLKRMEARTQYISITLTIGGAFLGVGWGQGAVALLLFPPLAALLAAAWAQNETRLLQLSAYIRDHLETKIPGLGWERFSREMDERSQSSSWMLNLLSVGGIFLLTQLLAIFLGGIRLTQNRPALFEYVLLGIAVASVFVVLSLINHVRRQSS